MKFANYADPHQPHQVQGGFVQGQRVYPVPGLTGPIGGGWGLDSVARLGQFADRIRAADLDQQAGLALDAVRLYPPVWPAPSFRDFYAFEQHVKTARGRRGLEMIPEWYQLPVFYFSNADALVGHEAEVAVPPDGEWMDFELEVAAVVGLEGRDIPVERAEQHIAGYAVLNDWSARKIQRQEMAVGLGPAKGKDFATSLGPWLVTPDELEPRRQGKGYDLEMVARLNGREISRGNWSSISYSFAEMLARASRGVWLRAGDIIGSGTVGTGCILELGTDSVGRWLAPGDVVELEIERLGLLRNRVAPGADEEQ